jgi:hypothetical protein
VTKDGVTFVGELNRIERAWPWLARAEAWPFGWDEG